MPADLRDVAPPWGEAFDRFRRGDASDLVHNINQHVPAEYHVELAAILARAAVLPRGSKRRVPETRASLIRLVWFPLLTSPKREGGFGMKRMDAYSELADAIGVHSDVIRAIVAKRGAYGPRRATVKK